MTQAHVDAYSPLADPARQIRLICTKSTPPDVGGASTDCFLTTVDLATAPPFHALSYMWGDPKTTFEVEINGFSINATRNLHDALMAVWSRSDVEYLWIDALCINQASLDEKCYQVPLMGQIYSRAESVLVWIGPAANESGRAMALFRRWGEAIERALHHFGGRTFSKESMKLVRRDIGEPLFDELAFQAAGTFFSRDYWRRMWIMQEIVLARQAVVLCGNDEVDLDHLRLSVAVWDGLGLLKVEDLIDAETQLKLNLAYAEGANLASIQTILKLRLERRRAADAGQPLGHSALNLVCLARPSTATDPRDKIFAVYGLLDDSQGYPVKPDYSSPAEDIYRRFAVQQMTGSGRLDILRFAGLLTFKKTASKLVLPSWVPDFSTEPLAMNLITVGDDAYHADRGATPHWRLSADERSLYVRGVICDALDAVTSSGDNDSNWTWTWWELAASHASNDVSATPFPAGVPWRQAFFRTLMADYTSPGFGSAEFHNADSAEWFLRRAEGFMSHMRLLALERARDQIRAQEAETGEKILVTTNDGDGDAEVTVDASKVANVDRFDVSTLYWLQNSTDNTDQETRMATLDAFLGGEHGPGSRLQWPFERYPEPSANSQNLILFLKATQSLCGGRAFAVTSKGYFALVPQLARRGDVVVVIFGCPITLLLRRVGNGFAVVGEVVVYGMMQGEMMEEVKAGRLVEEDLLLV